MTRIATFGGNNSGHGMSYNISNDLRTIQQEKHNSISCVYDILDLNNSGKWNDDGTIELYRPGSSSQLDMIKFRSFSANIRSDISTLSTPTVIGYLCCNFEFNENSEAVNPSTSDTDYCEGQEFIRDSLAYSDMTLNIANQAGNHQYQSANAIYDNDIQHEIILSEFQIPLVDSFDDSITDLLLQARYAFSKILGVFDTNDTNNETLKNQSSFTWYAKVFTDPYIRDGGYSDTTAVTYAPELSNITYLNIPGYSMISDPFADGNDLRTGQLYFIRATFNGTERNFMLLYEINGNNQVSICYVQVPNYFIYSINPQINVTSSTTYYGQSYHNALGFVDSISNINTYLVRADKLFWDSSNVTSWYSMNYSSIANSTELFDCSNTTLAILNSSFMYSVDSSTYVSYAYTRCNGDGSTMTSSIDLIQKCLRMPSGALSTLSTSYNHIYMPFNTSTTILKYVTRFSNIYLAFSALATLKEQTDYVYYLGDYIPFLSSATSGNTQQQFLAFSVFIGCIFNDDGTPQETRILTYTLYNESYEFGNSSSSIYVSGDMVFTPQVLTLPTTETFDFIMLDYINDKAATTTTPYRFDDFDYEMALYMWEIQNIHVPNSCSTLILPSVGGSRSFILNIVPTGTFGEYRDFLYNFQFNLYDMKRGYDNCYVQMNRGLMFIQCWNNDGNDHIITSLGSMCSFAYDSSTSAVSPDSVVGACEEITELLDSWISGMWNYRDITNIVKNLNVTTPILNFYYNAANVSSGNFGVANYDDIAANLATVLYAIDILYGADGMMYDISDYSEETIAEAPFVMANSNVSLILESRGEGYVWENNYIQFYPMVPNVTDGETGTNVYIWDDTHHVTAKNGAVYHALETDEEGSSFYDSIFTIDTSTNTSLISCPYLNMISSDYKYSGKLHFYVKFHTNPSVVNFDPNIIQHSRFSTEDNTYKQFINHTGNLGLETYPISRMYYFTDEDLYNRIVVYLGIQNTDQTLKLVVSGYGSTNDIVFYLNETSMIDYKDYVVDPTMRHIACAIYDASGEILTPSIASSIYSNITICCDWSFYN